MFALFVYAVIVTTCSKCFHYLPQLSFENIWRSFFSLIEIIILYAFVILCVVFPGLYAFHLESGGFEEISDKFSEKYPGKVSRIFEKLFV